MISVLSYFWWIFFRVMVLVFGNRLSFYINTKINTIKSNGTSCSWKKNVIFIFWALFWGMLHIHRPDTWNENSIATPLINKTSHSSVIFFFLLLLLPDSQTFFLHFVSFLLRFAPIPEMTVIFWNISLSSLARLRFPPSLCFSFVKDHTEGWHVGGTSRLGGPAAGKMWVTGSAFNRLWE